VVPAWNREGPNRRRSCNQSPFLFFQMIWILWDSNGGWQLFSSKTKADNLFDKKVSYTNQINFWTHNELILETLNVVRRRWAQRETHTQSWREWEIKREAHLRTLCSNRTMIKLFGPSACPRRSFLAVFRGLLYSRSWWHFPFQDWWSTDGLSSPFARLICHRYYYCNLNIKGESGFLGCCRCWMSQSNKKKSQGLGFGAWAIFSILPLWHSYFMWRLVSSPFDSHMQYIAIAS
jgi:hypothetical protein